MINIEDITCPCTRTIMFDPVSHEENTFEREFVEEYVTKYKKHPINATQLDQINLVSNVALKKIINNYLSTTKDHFDKDEVYFSKRFCNEIRDFILKNDVQSLKNKLATTLDYRYFTKPLTDDKQGDSAFYLASEKGSKESTATIFEYLFSKDLLKKSSTPPENWSPKYAIDLMDSYLDSNTFGDLEKQKVTELLKFDKFMRKCDSLYIENLAEKYSTKDVKIVEWLFCAHKILIEKKDKNGNTMIMRAALKSNLALFQYLIVKKADINVMNNKNENLFFILFKNEFCSNKIKKSIITKIYNLGINYIIDKYEKTNHTKVYLNSLTSKPLHLALIFYPSDLNLVEKCIKSFADGLNQPDANNKTPIFNACESADKNLVQLLIKSGANVNHVDKLGRNCLHYAVLKNSKEIITLLLQNDIFTEQADSQNKTPLDLASDTEMKNFLAKTKHELVYEKNKQLEQKLKDYEERIKKLEELVLMK